MKDTSQKKGKGTETAPLDSVKNQLQDSEKIGTSVDFMFSKLNNNHKIQTKC